MKISLICPQNYYGLSATPGIYYPMGILLVGSLVKDTYPDWEVQVIDGELFSKTEIESKLRGSDIVGLSANTNNYQYCVELAAYAKNTGTRNVVIGGPHASAIMQKETERIPMALNILKNQESIDAVIVNDGERAFLKYVQEIQKQNPKYETIENIYYRKENNKISNGKVVVPSTPPRIIDINFDLINLKAYWNNHTKEFKYMSEKFIEGFTHVGCAWRDKVGCTFCDIPYPVNNYQAPGRFWRDMLQASNELGVKALKDYGDCLTGNKERVEALLKARPRELEDFQISCYAKPNEVTEEMGSLMKNLNVAYAYLGFDSGSNRMLKNMKSGYSVDACYKAIEILEKNNIKISGNIIVGAEGEDEKSIIETEIFVRNAVTSSAVTQLHCSMLTPFPGAPMNVHFLNKYPEFVHKDVWDTELTKKMWIDDKCKAPYAFMEKRAFEINKLNPSAHKRYFGLKRPDDYQK